MKEKCLKMGGIPILMRKFQGQILNWAKTGRWTHPFSNRDIFFYCAQSWTLYKFNEPATKILHYVCNEQTHFFSKLSLQVQMQKLYLFSQKTKSLRNVSSSRLTEQCTCNLLLWLIHTAKQPTCSLFISEIALFSLSASLDLLKRMQQPFQCNT